MFIIVLCMARSKKHCAQRRARADSCRSPRFAPRRAVRPAGADMCYNADTVRRLLRLKGAFPMQLDAICPPLCAARLTDAERPRCLPPVSGQSAVLPLLSACSQLCGHPVGPDRPASRRGCPRANISCGLPAGGRSRPRRCWTLILGYPAPSTAYIGLFMMDAARQGQGTRLPDHRGGAVGYAAPGRV